MLKAEGLLFPASKRAAKVLQASDIGLPYGDVARWVRVEAGLARDDEGQHSGRQGPPPHDTDRAEVGSNFLPNNGLEVESTYFVECLVSLTIRGRGR